MGMKKIDFSPEAVRKKLEEFKKTEYYKEVIIPLIKALEKK